MTLLLKLIFWIFISSQRAVPTKVPSGRRTREISAPFYFILFKKPSELEIKITLLLGAYQADLDYESPARKHL